MQYLKASFGAGEKLKVAARGFKTEAAVRAIAVCKISQGF
jgi:hypothetical protein